MNTDTVLGAERQIRHFAPTSLRACRLPGDVRLAVLDRTLTPLEPCSLKVISEERNSTT